MKALRGTGQLTQLALRQDRVKLPAWILVAVWWLISIVSALDSLYPTAAARQEFARTIDASIALRSLQGVVFDTSLGGMTAWRMGTVVSVLVAIMAHQTIVRHARREEESGRQELVGSGAVGRHSSLAAAQTLAFSASLLIGVVYALFLAGLGEEAAGAWAFGLGVTAVAWIFAAIGSIASQVTSSARIANSISAAFVGAAFLLRAVGDARSDSSILTWMSPIGWLEQIRPFAEERWWLLAMMFAVAVAGVLVAHAMAARRDMGAGLVPPRPGPAAASPALRSPLALAWRLQRGPLLGWVLGIAVWAATVGVVAERIGGVIGDNPDALDLVRQLGGSDVVVDAYLTATLGLVGLGAAVHGMLAALQLRREEDNLRAEPVLATRVTRISWASSHLVFAIVGPAVVLVTAGAAMGLAHGLQTGELGTQVLRVTGAALVQFPATLVVAAIAFALFGALPRLTTVIWGVLVAFIVVDQFGELLQLDQWVINLAPFSHVPHVLATSMTWAPIAWLTAAALGFVAVGMVGVRSRDIG